MTPRTKAGRALHSDIHETRWHADQHKCPRFLITEDCTCGLLDAILAIEAEALPTRDELMDAIDSLDAAAETDRLWRAMSASTLAERVLAALVAAREEAGRAQG